MRTQARDLLAGRGVGHLERPALGRAPDRLDHVPQVVAVREELVVAPDRRAADDNGPTDGCSDHRDAMA